MAATLQNQERVSTRTNVYRDYLGHLSPKSATRILVFFLTGLLLIELALRIVHPHYERTAISSLHGVRAILHEVLADPAPKILAFGDSSLVGGGIYRHEETVLGRMEQAISKPRLYNLALPGGDSVTSAILLEQLQQRGVQKVDRVILETLPGKWMTITPAEAGPKRGVLESGKELRRLIPGVNLSAWGLENTPLPRTERVEVAAEWSLGAVSELYLHHDFLRTEVVGNYPTFWLIGKLLPRSLMAKLNPTKARGTNRLAARADDFDYDPQEAKINQRRRAMFSDANEGEALAKAIATAKQISAPPPILLAFPAFHELQGLEEDDRATFQQALLRFEGNLQWIAEQTGCELMLLHSSDFQDASLWTATPSHFNVTGAKKVWEAIRPRMCQLYPCHQ